MYPYWQRAENLDAEICAIMERSDLTVWHDSLHSCIHIMLGGSEFTSAMFPLNDQIRNELRQAAFLLHNGMNEDEMRRVSEANEKVEQYANMQEEEAKADWRQESEWTYKHWFEGSQSKPMVIVGGKE